MSLEGRLDITVTDVDVEFAFVVTNTAAEPIDVTFPSGRTADVTVHGDDGEVWRWSEGRMFTQVIRTKTVGPGESFTHHAVWDDPAPGEYTAEASLTAADASLVVRAEFEV